MSRSFLLGQAVSFRGQVGTVAGVDLTPGMVDVRYGDLVKRHRKEEVFSVSGVARTNGYRRPPRARRNGRLTDEVADIRTEIEAEIAALSSLPPSADAAENVSRHAALKGLQAKLDEINDKVFNKVVKKDRETRFLLPGELEDEAAKYLASRQSGREEGPRYGFTGLGPAGEEDKERRTKIPLTEKELYRKALLERGYSGTGAQLAEESAAWMTLPDPARYVGEGELCGNPIDGTMYVIAVNSKKRPSSVLVTPAIWEAAVANAGDNKKLDTPEKKLEAWTRTGRVLVAEWSDAERTYRYDSRTKEAFVAKRGQALVPATEERLKAYIQTDGVKRVLFGYSDLKRTVKRFGKGRKEGLLQPFTEEEVERITNPAPGYKRPGPSVRLRPAKGAAGKAARGPSEQYVPAEKERAPVPPGAQFVEDPPESGKYYYFMFARELSPLTERFRQDFSPPYDHFSNKKDSAFFSWQKMDRPFSRGGLEGNLFNLRVDTVFFENPGTDPVETLKARSTKLVYLSSQGPWARVRIGYNGPEGYVQKHHLVLREVSPFTQPPLCKTSTGEGRVKAAREVSQYLFALKKAMEGLRYQLQKGIENPDHPQPYIDQAGQKFLRALAWVGSWCQSMSATLLRQPVRNYRNVPILEIVASLGSLLDIPLIPRLAESSPVPLVRPNKSKVAYVAGAEEAGVVFDPKLLPSLFLPMAFSGGTGSDSVVRSLHERLVVVQNVKGKTVVSVKKLQDVIFDKWNNASLPHPVEARLGLPDTRSLYVDAEATEVYAQLQEEYEHPGTQAARKREIEAEAKEIRLEMEPLDRLRALYFMYHSMGGASLERDLGRAIEHVRLIRENAGEFPTEEAADTVLRLRELRKAGHEHVSVQRAKARKRAAEENLKELVSLRSRFQGGEDVGPRVRDLLKRLEEKVARAVGEEKQEREGELVDIRNAVNSSTPELLDHLIRRMEHRASEARADISEATATLAEERASLAAQSRFHQRGEFPFSGSRKDITLYYTFNPLLFEITRLSWNTKKPAWTLSPTGKLTPASGQRLRDVDTVGRYGYALKLFYEKALNKRDFQATVTSLEAAVSAGDLRQWIIDATEALKELHKRVPQSDEQQDHWKAIHAAIAEKSYQHAAVLEPGYGGQSNIAYREGTTSYGWASRYSRTGDPSPVAERLSEDPRTYLSNLRRDALNSLVKQRETTVRGVREHEEAPSARSTREAVATVPLQPLAAAAGRYLRTPAVGEGKPVPTSFLPQSTIAALEDAESDSQRLRNLIQERAAELRKKLPRTP